MSSAIEYLVELFGKEHILVRRTSSGCGFHVRIIGVEVTPEEEMSIRKKLGDCPGRRIADEGRLSSGMRTSRLFKYKGKFNVNNNTSTVKKASKWRTI